MSDEDRKMDHKVVFEPYDMDTALGTNNSGVLMFSPYLEDTDTVSSVIAGGDSGGSEAPVYNAQDSVLWNNIRDAFRSELVQMYRTLRASNGPWQYNAIEKRFEDHQAKWPEAIFNEDAWVKYIIPLVDPVTVDEETGELIRTDRYLTMLQGSKKEQRKWWLYNRLRYLDSKYDTGNASANIINIRFFNGGVLKLKTAIPMYAAVSFGGGTTPEIKRTEANTEVSFTYTPGTGVTEMETWIHSGNLITDVGDLSVFYPNECDFSKASLLRRLKIGDATAGYSNANLTTINVRNSPLLESIDCRNCPRLNITVNLENSPRLAEAYFDGTTITGLDLADGCAIETLHLPATVTALTLLNLTKLQEFYIPSYANVARLMMSNIDSTVVDPVTVLESIHSNAQVNIQGLYLVLQDAEAISDFYDLLDTFTGVTRERSATTGEWVYHDEERAVVSGEIHTTALTGEEIEAFNSRYPYLRTTADHTTTYLKYYTYDGAALLYTETIYDGGNGAYAGTPSRAADERYTYTFAGWTTVPNDQVDANATKNVSRNRSVYAAYTAEGQKYTVYFYNDSNQIIQTVQNVLYGGTAQFTGNIPTKAGVEDPELYEFIGWEPSNTNIQGNTACYPVYNYLGITTRLLLTGGYGNSSYENSFATIIPEGHLYGYKSNIMYDLSFPNATIIEPRALGRQYISLHSIYAPNVEYIGTDIFLSTYLDPSMVLSFPNLISVGDYALSGTKFYSLYAPKLSVIGLQFLRNATVSRFVLSSVLFEIGSSAFSAFKCGSDFRSAILYSNSSRIKIEDCAACSNNWLTAVEINCSNLDDYYIGRYIGISAFASCINLSLVSINLSAAVQRSMIIYSNAFANNPNLEKFYFKLTLSNTNANYSPIINFSDKVFYNCPKLSQIILDIPIASSTYYHSSAIVLRNSTVFSGLSSNFSIFVPSELVDLLKTKYGFSEYSDHIFSLGALNE